VGSTDKVLHLKLVNASTLAQPLTIDLKGVSTAAAKVSSLHAASYEATNSITDPEFIHPVASTVQVTGKAWKHTVPALTIEVIDIPVR
jgi:alpha-N-arabinofuranosidase